jgi:hypothetical protein
VIEGSVKQTAQARNPACFSKEVISAIVLALCGLIAVAIAGVTLAHWNG